MTPDRARQVTLTDVARHAGVSVATASFALSGRSGGKPTGSPHTQARVRAAAAELGYVPNRTARTMRTGRTDAIVLATGGVADPWALSVGYAVGQRGVEVGKTTLMLADSRWYEYLSGGQFDACLVSAVDQQPEGLQKLRRLTQVGGGVVIYSSALEPEDFDIIASDAMPSVAAAYHQLRSRHEEVHLLTPESENSSDAVGITRTQTFRAVAEEMGDVPLVHAAPDEDRVRLYRDCLQWLSSPDRPRAVIGRTGYLAIMLQAAAQEVGIAVPEELEIIGIGAIPPESLVLDPVTCYGVPDVFSRLADIVVHRAVVRHDEPGRLHRFPWEYFPGSTTLEPRTIPGAASRGTAGA